MRSESGNVVLEVSNASSSHQTYSAFVGMSKDPLQAVQAAFYSLRATVQTFLPTSTPSISIAEDSMTALEQDDLKVYPVVRSRKVDDQPVAGTWYEQWMDCMGFCTWNSMGIDVSHDKIMEALQILHDNEIRIGLVIIDDGWQQVDANRRLLAFEANAKFPKGLKYTVDAIKEKFPYVKHVAVWHALLGYWHAFSPDGEIAKKYEIVKGSLYNEDAYLVR